MKKKKFDWDFVAWVIMVIVGITFWSFVINKGGDVINKGGEFFDDRSAKKERCAERAEDASNSYAAKKIYKACMSN